MPVNPSNFKTLPMTIEPHNIHLIDEAVNRTGINRTKLIRMMVKYCLKKEVLKQVMINGDPSDPVEEANWTE